MSTNSSSGQQHNTFPSRRQQPAVVVPVDSVGMITAALDLQQQQPETDKKSSKRLDSIKLGFGKGRRRKIFTLEPAGLGGFAEIDLYKPAKKGKVNNNDGDDINNDDGDNDDDDGSTMTKDIVLSSSDQSSSSIAGEEDEGVGSTTSASAAPSEDGKLQLTGRGRFKKYFLETVGSLILYLYMTSFFLQFVSLQELIYAKSCHEYKDPHDCSVKSKAANNSVDGTNNSTTSAAYQGIQDRANHILLICVVIYTLPTILIAPIYAAISDNKSQKVAMALPFIFLISSSTSLILQSVYLDASVHWLFLSSLLTGLSGSYVALLGLSFAHISSHCHSSQQRSHRFAIHTGFGGLAQCSGFALIGPLRGFFGFVGAFCGSLILLVTGLTLCLIFVDRRARLHEQLAERASTGCQESILTKVSKQLSEVPSTLFRKRNKSNRAVILLCILAFFMQALSIQGSLLTTNYYLKHQINLLPDVNGYLEGSRAGVGTFMVLILYPILLRYGVSDHALSMFGDFTYLLGRVFLALIGIIYEHLRCSKLIFALLIFDAFVRFPQSGVRTILTEHGEPNEQAKLLTANSVLHSCADLLATLSFNNILTMSLHFFPPLGFIILAAIRVVPICCILAVYIIDRRSNAGRSSSEEDLKI